ncbi:hypothetical protein DV736_g5111, partial [Chaetothyriales sp. CBS 134916]
LPFPKPLSRAAFLTPDFDPADFLANLTSRFQTLDDLQAELRQLSATIQTELVDLVNDHYEEFLGLGDSLSGGEEKVEEVRVGLMGVERELGVLKERVVGERKRMAEVMQLKRDVIREANVGRRLLDAERRLGELELGMGIVNVDKLREEERRASGTGGGRANKKSAANVVGEEDDRPPRPLARRVEQWLCIKHLLGNCDPHHPFLVAEQPRLKRVNDTILRDIDTEMRSRSNAKERQRLQGLRREMEA